MVIEVDERYSTTQALSEGAQAHNVDALSACVILNQFFSQLRQAAALHGAPEEGESNSISHES